MKDNLISDDNSLYVRNTQGTTVSFDIREQTAGGKLKTIVVPSTWIPVDLSMQALRSDIEVSPDFRRAQMIGLLKLVDNETAQRELSSSDAQKEIQRVYNPTGTSPVDNLATITPVSSIIDSDAGEDDLIFSQVVTAIDEDSAISKFRILKSTEKMTDVAALRIAEHATESKLPNLFAEAESFLKK